MSETAAVAAVPLQETLNYLPGLVVGQSDQGGAEFPIFRAAVAQVQLGGPGRNFRQGGPAPAQLRHIPDNKGAGPVGNPGGVQDALQHIQISQGNAAIADTDMLGDLSGQGQQFGVGHYTAGTQQFRAHLGELAAAFRAVSFATENRAGILPTDGPGNIPGLFQIATHQGRGEFRAQADCVAAAIHKTIHPGSQIAAGFAEKEFGGFQDGRFPPLVAVTAD